MTIKPVAQKICHIDQLLSTGHLGQVLVFLAKNYYELVANFRYDFATLAVSEEMHRTSVASRLKLGLARISFLKVREFFEAIFVQTGLV